MDQQTTREDQITKLMQSREEGETKINSIYSMTV